MLFLKQSVGTFYAANQANNASHICRAHFVIRVTYENRHRDDQVAEEGAEIVNHTGGN